MPFGYLIGTGIMATYVVFAVAPPRPRQSSPVRVSFWLGYLVNELPFLAFFVLVASTALAIGHGDIDNPVGWIGLGLAVLATAGLVVVVRRAMLAGTVVDEALVAAGLPARSRRRLPIARILFWPFAFPHPGVKRVSNIRYGDAGRANLLDVYSHRARPTSGPVLIHLTARSDRVGSGPRRWGTTPAGHHRSSSCTLIGTRWSSSRTRGDSSNICARPRRIRSSTRSCPGRNMHSTTSPRSYSTR